MAYVHQTDSYLEDIVLQRKVREAVPKAACSRLGFLPCVKQVLAGLVDFELGHDCDFRYGPLKHGW